MPSKLYVGNLAFGVSKSDLEELFSKAGQVQSVAVITDKFSGQSRGFGFVEMANAENASKAIQQFTILSSRVEISGSARPNPANRASAVAIAVAAVVAASAVAIAGRGGMGRTRARPFRFHRN